MDTLWLFRNKAVHESHPMVLDELKTSLFRRFSDHFKAWLSVHFSFAAGWFHEDQL